MSEKDKKSGIILFFILVALLGGLIWSYLALHAKHSGGIEPELAGYTSQVENVGVIADAALAEQKSAADTKGTADAAADNAVDAAADGASGTAEETDTSSVQLLRVAVNSMKENWTLVSGDIYSLSAGQKKQIDLLISSAITASTADKSAEIKQTTASMLAILKNKHSLFIWSDLPWTYLEVLYWSLAGILVSVFFSTGYYLRRKTFLGSGVWMHISHVLTVPVIALVVVFVLSLLKLTVQIENSEVSINLDDPRLLVAISFIISVRPWAILDFVKETGERIFKQSKEKIGAGAAGEGTTTPPADK